MNIQNIQQFLATHHAHLQLAYRNQRYVGRVFVKGELCDTRFGQDLRKVVTGLCQAVTVTAIHQVPASHKLA